MILTTNVRNPQPKMEGNPFLQPLYNLIDLIAGAGIQLSALTVVIAAILLFFAYLMGGRLGKIVGLLICAIAAPILIINAGSVSGWIN